MEVAELRIIFSATFIILGSLVFYVSSLVSGHNIYRDVSFNLAIMVTTITGFILFIFSPICFVILFPELFGIREANTFIDQIPMNLVCTHSADVIYLVNRIHSIVLKDLLKSYLSIAVGLGLLFGCVSAISARASTLHWIREKTGLRYPIYTYGYTWDDLLMRVKSHGKVRIKIDNAQIEGQLVVHSIREEPKQIILKNYRQIHGGEEQKGNGEILITEQSNIKEIEVPSASFNKHNDLVSHTTQSFYTALSALAALLIATSLKLTSQFLLRNNFEHLSRTYLILSGAFTLLAVILILISDKLYRKDFCGWAAPVVLYPATALLIIMELYWVTVITLAISGLALSTPVDIQLHSIMSGTVCIVLSIYILFKNQSILSAYKEAISVSRLDREALKDVIEEIYVDVDFNRPSCQQQVEMVLQKKDPDLYKSLSGFISNFHFLWWENGFLKEDERNVLILLRNYLSKPERF